MRTVRGSSRGIVLGIAIALLFAVLNMPTQADAARHPKFHRTILRTDGLLTVGQQETLTVKGAPPRATLQATAEPSVTTTTQCFNFKTFDECLPEPLFSVFTGSSRFKASGKGRASLTFVMPPGFEFIDSRDPLKSHPVFYTDGERVPIGVSHYVEKHDRRGFSISISSLGFTTATVQVLPPPSP